MASTQTTHTSDDSHNACLKAHAQLVALHFFFSSEAPRAATTPNTLPLLELHDCIFL